MATQEELLRKLDERFILGEISDEQYQQLRARLQSQSSAGSLAPRDASSPIAVNADLPTQGTPRGMAALNGVGDAAGGTPATAGGMNIADSVIKGNVTSGSASVGSININLGQAGLGGAAATAELEYEKYVLLALHAGGVLENIRAELDDRRQALGLPIRLAREIEEACLASCGRRGAGPGSAAGPIAPAGPRGPDPVTRFFKPASASLASMFATQQSVQPTGPVRGTAPVPPVASASGKPPPPPPVLGTPVAGTPGKKAPVTGGLVTGPVVVGTPPPLPWATNPPGGPKAGERKPEANQGESPDAQTPAGSDAQREEIKAGLGELRAEVKAELDESLKPAEAAASVGPTGVYESGGAPSSGGGKTEPPTGRPAERKPPPLPPVPTPPPLPWAAPGKPGRGG